jgi:hypothetical protein
MTLIGDKEISHQDIDYKSESNNMYFGPNNTIFVEVERKEGGSSLLTMQWNEKKRQYEENDQLRLDYGSLPQELLLTEKNLQAKQDCKLRYSLYQIHQKGILLFVIENLNEQFEAPITDGVLLYNLTTKKTVQVNGYRKLLKKKNDYYNEYKNHFLFLTEDCISMRPEKVKFAERYSCKNEKACYLNLIDLSK